jgi:hypothetical protein
VRPALLARERIDGAQRGAVTTHRLLDAATVAVRDLVRPDDSVMDHVAFDGVDIKEARLRAVGGRGPVRCAAIVGRHERAPDLGLLRRIRNRLT